MAGVARRSCMRLYSVFSAAAADCAAVSRTCCTALRRDSSRCCCQPLHASQAATRPLATTTTGNNCFNEACNWARPGFVSDISFPLSAHAGVAETAGSAHACFEFFLHLQRRTHDRQYDQLRDAVPGLHRKSLAATVPDTDQQRPLVVGVDQPGAVAQHDPVLMAEA